jgi:hypothetical protein
VLQKKNKAASQQQQPANNEIVYIMGTEPDPDPYRLDPRTNSNHSNESSP